MKVTLCQFLGNKDCEEGMIWPTCAARGICG